MTTKKLVPRASGEGAMGVTDNAWGEAYYDTGNFNKGLFVKGSGIEDVIANTVTQGGLGGEWTRNGLDIYYNGGNVGIGTTNPGVFKTVFNNDNADTLVKIASGTDKSAALFFGEDAGSGGTPAWIKRYGSTHAVKPNKVEIGAVGTASWVSIQGDSDDVLNIKGSGNVGIGTANPGAELDVIGRIKCDSLTGNNGLSLASGGTGNLNLYHGIFGSTAELGISIASAGKVGIGTTDPATSLDINKGIGEVSPIITLSRGGISQSRFAIANATDSILAGALTNDLCIRTEGGNIRLGTASATKTDMSILSNGNVGIGITAPVAKLDILKGGSTQYDGANDIFRNSTGEHILKLSTGGWKNASVINQQTGTTSATLSSTGVYLNSSYGSKTFSSSSVHVNCGTGNGDISFLTGNGDTNPTTKVKIINNGNVGIGTTSPGDKLHISAVSGESPSLLRVSHETSTSEIRFTTNRALANESTHFIQAYNDNLRFFVGGGATADIAMTINSNGNVGIGTSNPLAKLEVAGVASILTLKSDAGERFCQANWSPGALSSGYNGYITVDSGPNANKSIQKFVIGVSDIWINDGFEGISIRCASSVQDSFIFKPNGNLYGLNWTPGATISINTNGEIVTSSDKRLKNDLGDCEYGLNEVLQLKPKKYTWKDGPKDQKPTIGFFAQDLYGVMEEAGPRTAKLDDKGNSVTDEDGKPDYDWGMNSNAIIAALVNSAKEQQQLIEDLKSRIETLENK